MSGPTQLLLDPRLPQQTREAIELQARRTTPSLTVTTPPGDHRVAAQVPAVGRIQLPVDPNAKIALRDASDSAPDAIVVVASDDDLSWFETHGRRWTQVERVGQSYRLLSHPQLLPLPKPRPASPFVASKAMVDHPELIAAIRGGTATSAELGIDPYPLAQLAASIQRAEEAGETPSVPLESAIVWLRRHTSVSQLELARGHYDTDAVSLPLEELRGGSRTLIWSWNERLFVFGPGCAPVVKALQPLHAPIDPSHRFAELHEGLTGHSPFTDRAKQLHSSVREWCGLSTSALEAAKRALTDPPDDGGIPAQTSADRNLVRRAIRDLVRREMTGVSATLLLELRAAMRGDIVVYSATTRLVSAAISVGAGRILYLRIARFGDPPAAALTRLPEEASYKSSMGTLDGGDVRVWISRGYCESLEGLYLPARERRRQAAARAADD